MAITVRYVSSSGTDTYANSTNINTPMSWATMLTNAAAGDHIKILPGTYSRTTNNDVPTNSGTQISPIILEGVLADGSTFKPYRNDDGTLNVTNHPYILYTTGSFKFTSRTNWFVKNLIFENNNNGYACETNRDYWYGCKIVNTNTNSLARCMYNAQVDGVFILCDFISQYSAIFHNSNNNGTRYYDCYFDGNTKSGSAFLYNNSSGYPICFKCKFKRFSSIIRSTNTSDLHQSSFVDCSFYNCTYLFDITTTTSASLGRPGILVNCIFSEIGTLFNYSYNTTVSHAIIVNLNCRLQNVTTQNTTTIADWTNLNTIISSSTTFDFVSTSSFKLSLSSPAINVGLNITNSEDIGAYQINNPIMINMGGFNS